MRILLVVFVSWALVFLSVQSADETIVDPKNGETAADAAECEVTDNGACIAPTDDNDEAMQEMPEMAHKIDPVQAVRKEDSVDDEHLSATLPPNGAKRTALEVAQAIGDQSGKIFLVTGAYSGIGVETTKALLAMEGHVIVAGRNAKLQEEFVEELKEQYEPTLIDGGGTLDLGDLASVRKFADYIQSKYEKIDGLILNAGVMACDKRVTNNGFEMQMGVNVIGHFLLAQLLLPQVQKAHGRQVWVSSEGHRMHEGPRIDIDYYRNFDMDTSEYSPLAQYQQSKLGNILLAKEFAKRYPDMESVSLHPGIISTNLGRYMSMWSFLYLLYRMLVRALNGTGMLPKSAAQGAATTITGALLPTASIQFVNGAYYNDCELYEPAESGTNMDDAKALYDYCDAVTKAFQ